MELNLFMHNIFLHLSHVILLGRMMYIVSVDSSTSIVSLIARLSLCFFIGIL